MQVLVKNLTGSRFSLDLNLGEDVVLRELFDIDQELDLAGKVTIDQLNRSTEFQSLVTANKLSARAVSELADLNTGGLLSLFLGLPIVATTDRVVADVLIANGALTVAAQPDLPRNLTVTMTDADSGVTAGDVTVVGTDKDGNAVTEVFTVANAGGTQTLTGTKLFASVTSATAANFAGNAAGDNIKVGVGDLIALPFDINNTSAVKHVYLGGVRIAAPTVAVGLYSSIDASSGTYNGAKALHALINAGG